MTTKVCFKCGVNKNLQEFYKHPMMGDGHLNKCKACTKADSNKHRADNLEDVRAYDRARAKTDSRKAKSKVYVRNARKRNPETNLNNQRRYRERNDESIKARVAAWRKLFPEKYAARNAVANALRDGKLTKTNCVLCGSDRQVQGHHPDYSKPLEVVWLCCDCHNLEHGKVPLSQHTM